MSEREAFRSRGLSFSIVVSNLLLGVSLAVSGYAIADQAAPTATLSGTVAADKPFRAAKVRAINVDKDILYMVFTSKGRYKAVALLPGTYRVSVVKSGFKTETRTIHISAGENATWDIRLHGGGAAEFVTTRNYMETQQVSQYLPYDKLYPPGPARDLVETHCFGCHWNDPSYLPAHPRDAAEWLDTVEKHEDPASGKGALGNLPFALIAPGTLKPEELKTLVAYLAANFGPGPKRGVQFQPDEIPTDEAALGKAEIVEYYLPYLDEAHTRRAAQDPHVDQNGNVWITENSRPARINMLNPATGQFKTYPLPSANAYPHGITVDANNDVWWDERDVGYIGRLVQATGKMIHYAADPDGLLPSGPWFPLPSGPMWAHTPVVDSKQNIWSSYIGSNAIGEWDRKAGRVTHLWRFPTTYGLAYGMDVDKHDNIWVAETGGCKVAKFDQATHRFTEYSGLHKPCEIFRVGVDPQGIAWYGTRSGWLGRVDPESGKVTERRIPWKFSALYDVQADHQGDIWFSDSGLGGAIVRLDPRSGKYSYYPTPQLTDIPRIDISKDGAVWYCARTGVRGAVDVLYYDITKFKELRSR